MEKPLPFYAPSPCTCRVGASPFNTPFQHLQQKEPSLVVSTPSPSALRDLTGNAPLVDCAQAAMSVADALQRAPHRGAQLMGVATSFLIMTACAGLTPSDLMGMARNCMNTAEGRRPEFAAVEDYINKEIFNSHGR